VLTDILWLTAAAESMTDAGLFVREADPQGGRRIFIALDEGAHEAMTRYFEALDE
jgi:DNA-binding MarR family transcriptional regulator